METIVNLNELMTNIQTLDSYLNTRVDPEYNFAIDLVKRGTCFVAFKDSNFYKFYPSRFIGYLNNSRDAHLNNDYKNGRETNVEISKILSGKPTSNPEINKEYIKYCETLGFTANDKGSFGVERKFWIINNSD